jgi:hypothetical protein
MVEHDPMRQQPRRATDSCARHCRYELQGALSIWLTTGVISGIRALSSNGAGSYATELSNSGHLDHGRPIGRLRICRTPLTSRDSVRAPEVAY